MRTQRQTRLNGSKRPESHYPDAAAKYSPVSLAKVLLREQAVRYMQSLVSAGVPREEALSRTAKVFSFRCSVSSVRRWERAYDQAGFPGLFEHKLGRVGRKPAPQGKEGAAVR